MNHLGALPPWDLKAEAPREQHGIKVFCGRPDEKIVPFLRRGPAGKDGEAKMFQNIFEEWREELWQSLRPEIARGMEGAEDVVSRVFFLDKSCWVDGCTVKKVGGLHTKLFGGNEAVARRAESEFKEVMTMIRRSGESRFSLRAWLE